jgi:RNA polymerase sigma-70 factor (ECF subfamily)
MRRAIQYVKLDGLSVAEAARQLGMTESAIKVSIHRGLKALSVTIASKDRS